MFLSFEFGIENEFESGVECRRAQLFEGFFPYQFADKVTVAFRVAPCSMSGGAHRQSGGRADLSSAHWAVSQRADRSIQRQIAIQFRIGFVEGRKHLVEVGVPHGLRTTDDGVS